MYDYLVLYDNIFIVTVFYEGYKFIMYYPR